MYLVNELVHQGHTVDIYAHKESGLAPESLDNIEVYRVWKKSFG